MNFLGRWEDEVGHERLRVEKQYSFYQRLVVATVVLQEHCIAFLAQQPTFQLWLDNIQAKERLWRSLSDRALIDPTPAQWDACLQGLNAEQQAALTTMRPFSMNASIYYRHNCDRRADEMDCNEVFTLAQRQDKAALLQSILQW